MSRPRRSVISVPTRKEYVKETCTKLIFIFIIRASKVPYPFEKNLFYVFCYMLFFRSFKEKKNLFFFFFMEDFFFFLSEPGTLVRKLGDSLE